MSKRQEQNTHGKSVDVTFRRRQAGRITRAGTTSPPKSITPDQTASTPARPVPKSVEKSLAPEDGRASPSTMATHSETLVTQTDESRTGRLESRGEPPALASPAGIEDGGNPVPPELPAVEKAKDLDRWTGEPSVPAKETMAIGVEDTPVENPTPPKPTTPDRRASTPVRPVPRSAEKSPAPEDGRASSSTMTTHSKTVVPKREESRPEGLEFREELGENRALVSPTGIKVSENPVPTAPPAVEMADDSSRRTVEPSVPAKATMATSDVDIPVENPTPPKPITPDQTASTPARPVPRSAEKSPAPEDGRASPSTMATHSETVVPKREEPRMERLESRGELGENGGSPVPPDLPAVEKADDSDRRAVEPSVPAGETMATGDVDIPVQSPVDVFFPQ